MKERYFLICPHCKRPAFESLSEVKFGDTIIANECLQANRETQPVTGDDMACQFCETYLTLSDLVIENMVIIPEDFFNKTL